MMRHAAETQGDNLSPITAAFPVTPQNPGRFGLMYVDPKRGRKYEHVQIKSTITVSSDWKLKSADILLRFHCTWYATAN